MKQILNSNRDSPMITLCEYDLSNGHAKFELEGFEESYTKTQNEFVVIASNGLSYACVS